MYIPEFICGFITGVIALVIGVIVWAVRNNGRDK